MTNLNPSRAVRSQNLRLTEAAIARGTHRGRE